MLKGKLIAQKQASITGTDRIKYEIINKYKWNIWEVFTSEIGENDKDPALVKA